MWHQAATGGFDFGQFGHGPKCSAAVQRDREVTSAMVKGYLHPGFKPPGPTLRRNRARPAWRRHSTPTGAGPGQPVTQDREGDFRCALYPGLFCSYSSVSPASPRRSRPRACPRAVIWKPAPTCALMVVGATLTLAPCALIVPTAATASSPPASLPTAMATSSTTTASCSACATAMAMAMATETTTATTVTTS